MVDVLMVLTPSLFLGYQMFPKAPCWGPFCFLFMLTISSFPTFPKKASLFFTPMTQPFLKPFSTPIDLAEFQSDINFIDAWFSNNHLTANASKTKVIVISTKQDPFPDLTLTLKGPPIDRVHSTKFLGVWLTDKLSWNLHVDIICKKSRKIIGFIHRLFQSVPSNIRRTLYIALIRPILEYDSATFNPLNSTLTKRFEATQRMSYDP